MSDFLAVNAILEHQIERTALIVTGSSVAHIYQDDCALVGLQRRNHSRCRLIQENGDGLLPASRPSAIK